ncbi:MAG: hypothetical protein AAF990_03490 [Bacteroidota bacterium]
MKFTNLFCLVVVLNLLLLGFEACTYDKIVIPENCSDDFTLSTSEQVDANCGNDNGSFEVIPDIQVDGIEFSLNGADFQTLGRFMDLSAGTYGVVARSADGCTASLNVEIRNGDGMNVAVGVQDAGCGEANGVITVNVENEQPPVTFRLDGQQAQASNVFRNLDIGTYQVTTQDANGCEVVSEVEIRSGVKFTEVETIIAQSCALSNCHGGSVGPDLRSADNIVDRAGRIAARTASKTMPPASSGLRLSEEEIAVIGCWVEDGAER